MAAKNRIVTLSGDLGLLRECLQLRAALERYKGGEEAEETAKRCDRFIRQIEEVY